MNVIAINGSPRKNGNCAAMLESWLEGIKSAHPDTVIKWINLYSLSFTGCRSCFHCKRKNGKFYGQCPIKDDLIELIPAVYECDALCISAPVYFAEPDAYTRCFLERLMFCKTTYRKNHESLAAKPVPATMIYTMNCPKDMADANNYPMHFDQLEWYLGNALKHTTRRVCAYNTYQFQNYANYEMEMFSEEEKRKYREAHFRDDLENAFNAGREAI